MGSVRGWNNMKIVFGVNSLILKAVPVLHCEAAEDMSGFTQAVSDDYRLTSCSPPFPRWPFSGENDEDELPFCFSVSCVCFFCRFPPSALNGILEAKRFLLNFPWTKRCWGRFIEGCATLTPWKPCDAFLSEMVQPSCGETGVLIVYPHCDPTGNDFLWLKSNVQQRYFHQLPIRQVRYFLQTKTAK